MTLAGIPMGFASEIARSVSEAADESTIAEDREFMERRVKDLSYRLKTHKRWERTSPSKMRTWYHVQVPEDGEDYWEPMAMLKLQDNSYTLTQVSTGLVRGRVKLNSKDCPSLEKLGEWIFCE